MPRLGVLLLPLRPCAPRVLHVAVLVAHALVTAVEVLPKGAPVGLQGRAGRGAQTASTGRSVCRVWTAATLLWGGACPHPMDPSPPPVLSGHPPSIPSLHPTHPHCPHPTSPAPPTLSRPRVCLR